MKKFTLVIAVVLVMIALFSVFIVSGEMPLRIVVNGDRLYFPDAQPFIVDTLRINPTKNTTNDMWKVYQKIWYTFLACYKKSSPPLK